MAHAGAMPGLRTDCHAEVVVRALQAIDARTVTGALTLLHADFAADLPSGERFVGRHVPAHEPGVAAVAITASGRGAAPARLGGSGAAAGSGHRPCSTSCVTGW